MRNYLTEFLNKLFTYKTDNLAAALYHLGDELVCLFPASVKDTSEVKHLDLKIAVMQINQSSIEVVPYHLTTKTVGDAGKVVHSKTEEEDVAGDDIIDEVTDVFENKFAKIDIMNETKQIRIIYFLKLLKMIFAVKTVIAQII